MRQVTTMNKISTALKSVAEMVVPPWGWFSFDGIRSGFRAVGLRFWPQSHPSGSGTVVNYDYCRQLYRNSGDNAFGAGFAKPIVDLQVGFMGLPFASTEDEMTDDFLNECLTNHWADELQQMFRDAIRDSKTIVRIRKPDILDPLMTIEEAQHCQLEIIPPDRVDIERSLSNRSVIERAVILHRMTFVIDNGDVSNGVEPQVEEHDVLEIITRENYSFFDKTTNEYLEGLAAPNRYGFVPLVEVFNEWDAALQGGQSDFETVIPFINAFHDILVQGLQAHKYHSTPKVKLKLGDVAPFIRNNFPEALDENGNIKPNAEISWRGREILFLQDTDEMEFLEARSVLGDTKTLAEFIIDCICIASQTPEWAFMRVDSGSANSDRNAQTVPFVKKIERKRRNYAKAVQELLKMVMVITGEIPIKPKLTWEVVRADDQMIEMQAFQQLVMGLEVAAQRGEISDETYRKMVRQFVPMMKRSDQEAKDALKNRVPAIEAGAPAPQITSGPQGENE
jgi:hypothetical protein